MNIEGATEAVKAVMRALPNREDENAVRKALNESGFSVSQGCISGASGRKTRVEMTVSKNGMKVNLALDL